MPDATTLAFFAVAAVALLVVPGPVVLYTVARSVDQGLKAGFASTVAVGCGDFCHVIAATLGLSALLMSSATAFAVVKYAGAAYLLYLGVRALLSRPHDVSSEAPPPLPISRIASQGFVVALLNPKTSLFFLAFLPQFVDTSRGDATVQIFVLGSIFVVLGVCTNTVYALLAGAARTWLRRNRAVSRHQRFLTGGVYIGLGLTAAFASGERR
jgi:threonine/homoserine/homoserine lactone efflux protein